jgi:hypothetical protein
MLISAFTLIAIHNVHSPACIITYNGTISGSYLLFHSIYCIKYTAILIQNLSSCSYVVIVCYYRSSILMILINRICLLHCINQFMVFSETYLYYCKITNWGILFIFKNAQWSFVMVLAAWSVLWLGRVFTKVPCPVGLAFTVDFDSTKVCNITKHMLKMIQWAFPVFYHSSHWMSIVGDILGCSCPFANGINTILYITLSWELVA